MATATRKGRGGVRPTPAPAPPKFYGLSAAEERTLASSTGAPKPGQVWGTNTPEGLGLYGGGYLYPQTSLGGTRAGGSGSATSGTSSGGGMDLSKYENAELDAMRRLLGAQAQAQRTELEAQRTQAASAFEQFRELRKRKLAEDYRLNNNALSERNILDSGIMIRNANQLEQGFNADVDAEQRQTAALVAALSRQIGGSYGFDGGAAVDYGPGSLAATADAQMAGREAEIRRQYLQTRLQAGR